MSTRSTIKYGEGYHLYNEVFDNHFVYLELDNVEVTLSADGVHSNLVVAIPKDIAKELGLPLGDIKE